MHEMYLLETIFVKKNSQNLIQQEVGTLKAWYIQNLVHQKFSILEFAL